MTRDFSRADTGVFWDVVDCPSPDDYDPISIHHNIKSVITDKGFRKFESVEIKAYGEKNKNQDAFLLAGIPVVPAGDKCGRNRRMIWDILFWALDTPSEYHLPQNVMVIAKNISDDTELLSVLQILGWRYYNILLVDSDNVASLEELEFVSSVWRWKSIVDVGYPIFQSRSLSGSSHGDSNKRKRDESSSGGSQGSLGEEVKLKITCEASEGDE